MSTPMRKPSVRSGKACTFVPRSYHVLMVKHDSPERITSLSSTDTLLLRIHYIHAISGEVEHSVTWRLKPTTLYFTATTNYLGFAYVQQYSQKLQRFACSCMEGKTQGFCCHCEELERLYPPSLTEA